MASKRPKSKAACGGRKVGVPQNITRMLFAVIWPDHFKFASYGAVTAPKYYSSGSIEILVFSRIHCEIDIIVYVRTATL